MQSFFEMSHTFDPRFIHWYEGMFLMPQHFQQNDICFINMQRYLLENFHHFAWGIKKLKIDEAALFEGFFRIEKVECVFKTGDVLMYDVSRKENNLNVIYNADLSDDLNDNSSEERGASNKKTSYYDNEDENDKGYDNDGGKKSVLEMNLEDHLSDIFHKPRKVYLCLPRVLSNRYSAANATLVNDLFSGGSMGNDGENGSGDNAAEYVSKLNLNVSLIVSEFPPARYISIPLVELSSNASGLFVTEYTPPMIFLDSSCKLMSKLNDIVLKIRRKIGYFGRKTENISIDAQSSGLKSIMMMRSSLVANFLKFDYMVRFNAARPYEIFQALLALAGSVSIVGSRPIPMLDEYDYTDINGSFYPLIDYVNDVLDSVHESYEEEVAASENNVIKLFLNESDCHENVNDGKILLEFFVKNVNDKDLLENWIDSAIICSEQYISSVCDSRILGANREKLKFVEKIHLFPRNNSVLVQLDYDDEYIVPKSHLLIFNLEGWSPDKAVLYRFKPI